MELEWDDGRRLANLATHGLGFARASELFAGLVVAADDTRREDRGRRVIAIGSSAENVPTCVDTDRTTADGRVVRRIVSLRPASR